MRDTRQEILHFWFDETKPQQWFQSSSDFDSLVRDRFMLTYDMARDGLCDGWQRDAQGCLALCLVLDQFPRNMFRDDLRAFSTDDKARSIAGYAISKGFDQVLPPVRRRFVYLPYEHSEDIIHQRKAVALFETMKKEDPLGYEYAVRHHNVIKKFGRFPHRNTILGRKNTPEEEEYLARPDAGF